MAAQLADEEKIKAADYVIDNSGPLKRTSEQVRHVWEKLRTAHEFATGPAIHPAK
jgi:dephospho-CoA kinase